MTRPEILRWLQAEHTVDATQIYSHADAVRRANFGDAVHLCGLISISNHCRHKCAYCGLHAGRTALERYRMSPSEVVASAKHAAAGFSGGVVLQGGDDEALGRAEIAAMVRAVREKAGVMVTLSVGDRVAADLEAWREAGATGYWLRYETTDAALLRKMNASSKPGRVATLNRLKSLGYRIGTGFQVGLPGQTRESVAADIEMLASFAPDVIVIGPYIAHPDTAAATAAPHKSDQMPASMEMVYRVIALARRMHPRAHILAPPALGTLHRTHARETSLMRGANGIALDISPAKMKRLFDVYPNTALAGESPARAIDGVRERIRSMGRRVSITPAGRWAGASSL